MKGARRAPFIKKFIPRLSNAVGISGRCKWLRLVFFELLLVSGTVSVTRCAKSGQWFQRVLSLGHNPIIHQIHRSGKDCRFPHSRFLFVINGELFWFAPLDNRLNV